MDVRQILADAKTIAVVGLSPKPHRDSNSVARYLQAAGYRIIPVNPAEEHVLDERSYATLRDIPDPVDIVDVFRRAEHTPAIAEDAVAIGAKVLWLQLGVESAESRRIAEDGGLIYIEDSCIRTVHQVALG